MVAEKKRLPFTLNAYGHFSFSGFLFLTFYSSAFCRFEGLFLWWLLVLPTPPIPLVPLLLLPMQSLLAPLGLWSEIRTHTIIIQTHQYIRYNIQHLPRFTFRPRHILSEFSATHTHTYSIRALFLSLSLSLPLSLVQPKKSQRFINRIPIALGQHHFFLQWFECMPSTMSWLFGRFCLFDDIHQICSAPDEMRIHYTIHTISLCIYAVAEERTFHSDAHTYIKAQRDTHIEETNSESHFRKVHVSIYSQLFTYSARHSSQRRNFRIHYIVRVDW